MIAVNTNLAAAAGAVVAMFVSWAIFKKADVGMTLNGALAGLVGITAGCANVTPLSSVILGGIAGVLVVYSVLFFDRIGVDDPVGAISVHGVCGAWGTLAAGIFNASGFTLHQLGVQAIGVVTCFVWTFVIAFILFNIIKRTIGLRVTADEEKEGLDFGEHGGNAYPDFQVHPSSYR
jgi:Amt family ammonium transporter